MPSQFNRPAVSVLAMTPDGEALIERTGRLSYGSKPSATPEARANWIRQRKTAGDWSIFEHVSVTFLVRCSRVVSHELVRHRMASYTQQSQRFREPRADEFIIPPTLPPEYEDEWEDDYAKLFALYEKWRGRLKRQEARYMLPAGASTQVAVTMNLRELHHVMTLRSDRSAQPEMRVVANLMLRHAKANWPTVFEDLAENWDDLPKHEDA